MAYLNPTTAPIAERLAYPNCVGNWGNSWVALEMCHVHIYIYI